MKLHEIPDGSYFQSKEIPSLIGWVEYKDPTRVRVHTVPTERVITVREKGSKERVQKLIRKKQIVDWSRHMEVIMLTEEEYNEEYDRQLQEFKERRGDTEQSGGERAAAKPVEKKTKESKPKKMLDELAALLDSLTLDEIYKKASKYLSTPERDLRKKYEHLQNGLQRMNLGNRMRAVWKKTGKLP